jgi:hypothetical protein
MCTATISCFAEYRVWTDKKGNTVEAEFIRVSGDKIVLCNRDGKEYRLTSSSLCDEDQEHLKEKIPDNVVSSADTKSADIQEKLRIEINFKKNTDTRRPREGSSYTEEEMVCSASITKKTTSAYDQELKATLYVLGVRDSEDQYVMLDKTEHTFNFRSSPEVLLTGERFLITYYGSSSKYDTKYEGYLIVVRNATGEIIEVKASSNKFEKNIDTLRNIPTSTYFRKDLNIHDSKTTKGIYY